ncbi:MAG: PfkB family carbohydrate kinase [Acidimicrobiales bacterium]
MTRSSDSRREPRVAVFAPAPVLVCTFEHPHDRADPDVALNVGGQGPWVARAVTALGAHAILVVPLGGDTGRAAHHLLSDAPHEVRAVDTQAGIACYIEERREGERTCIRDAPPGRFGQRELDDLYSAALAAALDADVCVITGSPWTEHVDHSLLTRLTADLANLERTTVADLSGAQLDAALEGGVDWLKVADDELGDSDETKQSDDSKASNESNASDQADGPEGAGEADLWRAAVRLSRAGKHDRGVVISRAAVEPTLVIADHTRYRITSPALTTVDARGSGDAMTAALATGLAEDRSIEDVLRQAAAAGAANAVHKGSATPDAQLVERLARTVEVETVH